MSNNCKAQIKIQAVPFWVKMCCNNYRLSGIDLFKTIKRCKFSNSLLT